MSYLSDAMVVFNSTDHTNVFNDASDNVLNTTVNSTFDQNFTSTESFKTTIFAFTSTDSSKTPGPNVELDTIDAVRFYSSVLATICICLGMCGNTLSILIWKQQQMRSSTGIYLIGQAVADMGLLMFFFMVESLPALAPSVTRSIDYGIFYAYFGYPFFYFFLVCSIWFTVGVTIDRFIQIRWPLKAKVCSITVHFIGSFPL